LRSASAAAQSFASRARFVVADAFSDLDLAIAVSKERQGVGERAVGMERVRLGNIKAVPDLLARSKWVGHSSSTSGAGRILQASASGAGMTELVQLGPAWPELPSADAF
jgi:hypothetical protein